MLEKDACSPHPTQTPFLAVLLSVQGVDSAQAALGDYFLKKKTRLQRTQLELLLRRVPGLVPGLLPEVLKQAAVARNEYLQVEAFLLLAAVLKVRRRGVQLEGRQTHLQH